MNDINIQLSRVEYVTSGMSLNLYTQGCRVMCPGCNQKQYWDFRKGKSNLADAEQCLKKFGSVIKKIVITGGEPLQQDLIGFMDMLKLLKTFDKEIWILTSRDMHEVYPRIREYADYIKTGIHDPLSGPGITEYGYKMSSKNQRVWKKGVHY